MVSLSKPGLDYLLNMVVARARRSGESVQQYRKKSNLGNACGRRLQRFGAISGSRPIQSIAHRPEYQPLGG